MNHNSNLSVIICAYNPNKTNFEKVIQSLKIQSLAKVDWELIVVDNNSPVPIATWLNLDWHPDAKIVQEQNPGLIHARIAGTHSAKYEYLVSVDDDTPLFPDYLEQAKEIFSRFPDIGIIGGRSFPIYEIAPPNYINEFQSFLAIRDLGETEVLVCLTAGESLTEYPEHAPILIAPRKACMLEYISFFKENAISETLGRKAESLASGEDNDINLFIFKKGFKLGYFPQLKFYHIIPSKRLNPKYFERMAYESNRSWVKVLNLHNILPWQPIKSFTLPFRIVKSYFQKKAWQNEVNYIKWKASCGIFKGLTEVK